MAFGENEPELIMPRDEPEEVTAEDEEWEISDEELLSICKSERLASIGFDGDGEVSEQRAKALKYGQGELPDLPAPEKRSAVVSTDVADAVETVLPDLMEIFTGGEDVVTFKPDGEEDEAGAKQETKYIKEVVFDQNDGFLNIYSLVKDALLVKTGIAKVWYDEAAYDDERLEGQTEEQMLLIQQRGGEISNIALGEDGTVSFDVRRVDKKGACRFMAVDPKNFGVSKDTVKLSETPYCVMRAFPRAYELTDDGYDPDLIARLPESSAVSDTDKESEARDTVDESEDHGGAGDSLDTRRVVEIHEHWFRVDVDGDGKTELVCVVTDADESMILEKSRKNRVGFAAGSPYVQPHRFFGESLADKLMEVQKIKTALMRMLMDSGYFTLNRRYEVAMDRALKGANGQSLTIEDLLDNTPGKPVRVRTAGAVQEISQGNLGFDVPGALEYFSTVGEQRSGVTRNAQGLNPDTLHDTEGGMQRLFSAAQRRTRMIARLLAETLLKDLFSLVHAETREHASGPSSFRDGREWVEVDPTSWGSRSDMTIGLGVGSGGREEDQLVMRGILDQQKQIVEFQGGADGPLVTLQNIHAALTRSAELSGQKAPERFFTDPAPPKGPDGQPAPAQPQQQKPPSPEEQKMQADQQMAASKMQMDQRKAERDLQLAQQKAESEMALARYTADLRAETDRRANEQKMALEAQRQEREHMIALRRIEFEEQMAERKFRQESVIAAAQVVNPSLNGSGESEPYNVNMRRMRPGGDLDK